MKQTAVEWLVDKLMKGEFINSTNELVEQAKAMEKQQMKETWEDGFSFQSPYNNFKEYYNETYGK